MNNWQVKAISLEIMEEACSLPDSFHTDPAERIIVATARINDATVVTKDQKILGYPHVRSFWYERALDLIQGPPPSCRDAAKSIFHECPHWPLVRLPETRQTPSLQIRLSF